MATREQPVTDSAQVPNRGTALVTPDSRSIPTRRTGVLILGTIADTTWRMFVPVIALLLGGMWLDGKTGHKPLFALLGVIAGFGLAIALVYQQYKGVVASETRAKINKTDGES